MAECIYQMWKVYLWRSTVGTNRFNFVLFVRLRIEMNSFVNSSAKIFCLRQPNWNSYLCFQVHCIYNGRRLLFFSISREIYFFRTQKLIKTFRLRSTSFGYHLLCVRHEFILPFRISPKWKMCFRHWQAFSVSLSSTLSLSLTPYSPHSQLTPTCSRRQIVIKWR